jgi:hypothetical protein
VYVIELKIIDVVLSEDLAYRIGNANSAARHISDVFESHNSIKLML